MEEPNEHRDRQGTGDVDENGDLIEALADGLRARVDAARLLPRGSEARDRMVDEAFAALDRLIDAIRAAA